MTANAQRLPETVPVTTAPAARRVSVSVVVLVSERPGPLADVYRACAAALSDEASFEFLAVAEPWAADHLAKLNSLAEGGAPIRTATVGQALGETALLRVAADLARGDVLLVLPAYPRVDPSGYGRLVAAVREGADVAVAKRSPRVDPWINRVQSRLFHALVRGLLGSKLSDIASGVMALNRRVLDRVPLYGDQFRFLPVLVQRDGFVVREVPIPQHTGDGRRRIYRPGVYLRRLLDLAGLYFVLRFTEKPLRFFGLIGGALVAVGGALLFWLLIERLGGQGIANRPILLVGNLAVVLGIQLMALGLIGEVIVHLSASTRRSYRLRDD